MHEVYPYKPPRVESVGPADYRLFNSIVVGRPLAETFEFCRDTRYLNEISPPSLRFRPKIHPEQDVHITEGMEIEYEMRLHGIPVKWRSRISDFNPPYQFVDEQIEGPYVKWEHRHVFRAVGDRNTEIADVVDYTLPGGGFLAIVGQRLFIESDLCEVFEHRSIKYREILGEPVV